MKHLCLASLALFCVVSISAQDSNRDYLDDKFDLVASADLAEYYRISEPKDELTNVTVYYNNGQVKMTGSYVDEELTIEEGEFKYFYRNGQIESLGMCSEGLKYGVWKRYLWDGTQRPDRFYTGTSVERALGRTHVTQGAKFPGGDAALQDYISHNMKYPEPALKQNIEGEVHVSLKIDAAGKVSNVEIIKGVHFYLDKEAERLVSDMPLWEPAYRNGAPEESRFIVPITFRSPSNP